MRTRRRIRDGAVGLVLCVVSVSGCHEGLCTLAGCVPRIEVEYDRPVPDPHHLRVETDSFVAEVDCPGSEEDGRGNAVFCSAQGFVIHGYAVISSGDVFASLTDTATEETLVDDVAVEILTEDEYYPNGRECDEHPCRERTASLVIP